MIFFFLLILTPAYNENWQNLDVLWMLSILIMSIYMRKNVLFYSSREHFSTWITWHWQTNQLYSFYIISEELKFKTDISWQGKDGFQTITKYADFIFEQPLFSLTKELTRTTATGTFFVFKNSLVCDWVFGILIFCYSPYIPPPFWEDIKLYFQFAPLSMPVMAW